MDGILELTQCVKAWFVFRVILMTGKYVNVMEVSVQFSSLAGSVESSLSSVRW